MNRFKFVGNGVVCDYELRLVWFLGADVDTSMLDAMKWAESLGVGARLPTPTEAASLYQEGRKYLPEAFPADYAHVWCLSEPGEVINNSYSFALGCAYCGDPQYVGNCRAVAVREMADHEK